MAWRTHTLAAGPTGGCEGGADPQLAVGDDLVVAAAAGVELAAYVAEAVDEGTFDVGVDVFQGGVEEELSAGDTPGHVTQGGDDLPGLVSGEQADLGEHARVSLAGADVVPVEPLIVGDR